MKTAIIVFRVIFGLGLVFAWAAGDAKTMLLMGFFLVFCGVLGGPIKS